MLDDDDEEIFMDYDLEDVLLREEEDAETEQAINEMNSSLSPQKETAPQK